jgi:hypothetical protein
MNTHQSYTLASQPQTGGLLRSWSALWRGAFSAAIFLSDFALIVAMSCFTGIAYHLVVYGNSGDVGSFIRGGALAACIFTISNLFRREYRLPNFFSFKFHGRRTVQLWNVTLICLLMLAFLTRISVEYSRGWIVLFYVVTLASLIVSRYAIVRISTMARAAGLISAQRIFLIGTGADIGGFINRYEPWTIGINIVGCRFLTPVMAAASAKERSERLDLDLAEAVAGVRSLAPDAVFVLLPWSATAMIERCAETFLSLPVEIHLGPEQVLHKFDEVKLSTLGPISSLQITPLRRRRSLRLLRFSSPSRSSFGSIAADRSSLASAATASISSRSASSSFAPCTALTTAADRPPAATRASPELAAFCDAGTSTRYRSSSTCSPGTCRWSDRGRIRCRSTRITSGAFRFMRAGTTSGRGLPVGHRCTAAAAKPTPMKRCADESDLAYIDNWSMWLDLRIIVRTLLSRAAYRNAY